MADVVTAANNNQEVNMASVKNAAAKGIGQAITERPTAIDLKTSFDSGTNTITISTTKTDFQGLYEETYTKEQGKAPVETETVEEVPLKANAQPEMTSTPEVGTILAKILKDTSKPAYINGKANLENYTAPLLAVSINTY